NRARRSPCAPRGVRLARAHARARARPSLRKARFPQRDARYACRVILRGRCYRIVRVDEQLKQNALDYHRRSPPGKISILPTKQLTNQRDLALAYSPGVAAACDEIVRDPACAALYTSRANLIAVITNGTAVLGL